MRSLLCSTMTRCSIACAARASGLYADDTGAPAIHGQLDHLDIGCDIVIIFGWRVDGDDLVDGRELPVLHVLARDEPVPVGKARLPGAINAVAVILRVARRGANIAERVRDGGDAPRAKGALLHEKGERVGGIDAILHAIVVERLALAARGRAVVI